PQCTPHGVQNRSTLSNICTNRRRTEPVCPTDLLQARISHQHRKSFACTRQGRSATPRRGRTSTRVIQDRSPRSELTFLILMTRGRRWLEQVGFLRFPDRKAGSHNGRAFLVERRGEPRLSGGEKLKAAAVG